MELTSEQGHTVWMANYTGFGQAKVAGGRQYEARNPIRFQGQYEDDEIGLHYNRFRYYDPLSGQYTQQDSIGLHGGTPNLYEYPADPVHWIDPLGLHKTCGETAALEDAEYALGDGLTRLTNKSRKNTPATTIGGTSTETGVSVMGQSVQGYGSRRCAELDVAAQVGGDPKKIVFTKPVRPRTGEIVPVCKECQKVFDKSQFPPGTLFD